MRRWIPWLVVLVGCGGASDPEPTTPSPSVAVVELSSANPRAVALPAHSLWSGRYECAQGVTGLALTLDLESGARATALFDFGPAPENPMVPSGRYLLAGRFDPLGNGGLAVTLVPDRWIAQPPGYVMVGMSVAIDPSARTMQGRIDEPSCTVVVLGRVQ